MMIFLSCLKAVDSLSRIHKGKLAGLLTPEIGVLRNYAEYPYAFDKLKWRYLIAVLNPKERIELCSSSSKRAFQ